jgi:hypothetical protein
MARVGSYLQRVGAGRLRGREPEAEPEIPAERMAQVQAVLRRRTSDLVEDAFRGACLAGDTATARDLLVVLDRMVLRAERSPEGDRRLLSDRLARLRQELERSQAAQQGVEGETL